MITSINELESDYSHSPSKEEIPTALCRNIVHLSFFFYVYTRDRSG